jgi:mannose-1-phosphate guanylyltransferase
MNLQTVTGNVWSIILATEESQHAKPLIERWLGGSKPNQYCAFVGRRSLFQHTVDRSDLVTSPERRLVVASEAHRAEVYAQLEGRSRGPVILQPRDCGTVPAVYLALAHVKARNPEATVLIFSSDHFFYPEHQFLSAAWQAVWAAEQLEDKVVILGVKLDAPEPDSGWILPGSKLLENHVGSVLSVSAILENPRRERAERAIRAGALQNTLFMASKARTLWKLGRRFFPLTMALFEWIGESLGTEEETDALRTSYRLMGKAALSGELLGLVPDRLAVVPLVDGRWSDWGKPTEIIKSIREMGKEPAFPPELVESMQAEA